LKLAKINKLNSQEPSPQKEQSASRKEYKIQETTDLMAMLQACTQNINKLEFSNKKSKESPEKIQEKDEEEHVHREDEKIFEVDLSRTCSPQKLREAREESPVQVIPVQSPSPSQPPVLQQSLPLHMEEDNNDTVEDEEVKA